MMTMIEKGLIEAESIMAPPIVVVQRRHLTVKDIVLAAHRVKKKYGISAINGTRLLLNQATAAIERKARVM